jgi:hypothetical protein
MKRWLQFAVSLGITVVALWWTFKDTPFDTFMVSLRGANWLMLLPYLVVLTAIHLARTLRWGNLLSGLEVVPFKRLNEAAAIGFMMLIILPFRLGEFARPFLIAQRSGIRRSAAMTTVVFERVVDGMAIAILLRILLFFVPGEPGIMESIRAGATVMFLVFGGGLAVLLLGRWKHDLVVGAVERTLGRVAPSLGTKVVGIVDGFLGAMRQLPDRANMAKFFAWTAAYWAANGFGVMLLANAFSCDGGTLPGCAPLHLDLIQGFLVLCVSIVGLMIPAGPASTGTMQSFVKLALSAFAAKDVVNGSGVAFANVLWLVQVLQQIAFGLVFLGTSQLSFTQIAGELSAEQREADRAG